jgi:arylsulfate sulfotransferase
MRSLSFASVFLFAAGISPLAAQISASLASSAQSPIPVGTAVTLYPNVSNAGDGTLWYRYRVRRDASGFRMIRDFGPDTFLIWAEGELEGRYEVELTVRNIATNESATTTATFLLTSRAAGGQPVVSNTNHPLVLLYSAPPCPAGASMRIQFQDDQGNAQYTPYKACREGLSMNFYLAGLYPNTRYSVHHTVDNGPLRLDGPTLTATTGGAQVQTTSYYLQTPPSTPAVKGILLQSTLASPTLATDLAGNPIWYYTGNLSFLTHPVLGGHFLGILQDAARDSSYQIVREFDLAGYTVQETNAARVSEQLLAMNRHPITSFHHDARRLPDGNLLVLATVEQVLTDVQGPGPVDVLGDMILVLNRQLEVVWAWDSFDHLDTSRLATLREVCTAGGGGCPPFYLAPQANDWLHGNSVQLTPDGQILYSARHQDWLIKLDYGNGLGSGAVLWRLGKDGDFQYNSSDPYPWFSHQHDGYIDSTDPSKLAVFDNGNVRRAADQTIHSRGQVIQLDEQNRVATPLLNADLGAYALAVGSARPLPNGNYHFHLGFLSGLGGVPASSRAVEVDPSGNIVYQIQAQSPIYRSFRMQSMYVP